MPLEEVVVLQVPIIIRVEMVVLEEEVVVLQVTLIIRVELV
jgi:hypothetical protein